MKSLRAPLLLSVALVVLCVPASAEMPAACRVAEPEVVTAFPLPRTADAIVKKKIDAMRAVDPDRFGTNLDSGINAARSAGADVVLVNSQYSPRTESMIALGAYNESMRWVALQQELPLFDRFGIMRLWSEEGTFNFHSATKKLDTAERVHDCIGRLLATLVAEGVRLAAPPGGGR